MRDMYRRQSLPPSVHHIHYLFSLGCVFPPFCRCARAASGNTNATRLQGDLTGGLVLSQATEEDLSIECGCLDPVEPTTDAGETAGGSQSTDMPAAGIIGTSAAVAIALAVGLLPFI